MLFVITSLGYTYQITTWTFRFQHRRLSSPQQLNKSNLGEVTVAPLHKRAFKSSVRAVPIVEAIARMQAGRPRTIER